MPVFNGLTDEFHPTQMLADVLTMTEHCSKPLHEIAYAFVGDGRNNVANSLLLVGAKLGMDVRIGAPRALWPSDEHVARCREFADGVRGPDHDHRGRRARRSSAWTSSTPTSGSRWASRSRPGATRIELLLPLPGQRRADGSGGQPAACKFMHCLPAFHNAETAVGARIAEQYPHLANGIEVTEDVFESPANIAFDQAENRMHTIKAVLVAPRCG